MQPSAVNVPYENPMTHYGGSITTSGLPLYQRHSKTSITTSHGLLSVESAGSKRHSIVRQKSSTETSGLGSSIEWNSSYDNVSYSLQTFSFDGGQLRSTSGLPNFYPQAQPTHQLLSKEALTSTPSRKVSHHHFYYHPQHQRTQQYSPLAEENPIIHFSTSQQPVNTSVPTSKAERWRQKQREQRQSLKLIRHRCDLETVESGGSGTNGATTGESTGSEPHVHQQGVKVTSAPTVQLKACEEQERIYQDTENYPTSSKRSLSRKDKVERLVPPRKVTYSSFHRPEHLDQREIENDCHPDCTHQDQEDSEFHDVPQGSFESQQSRNSSSTTKSGGKWCEWSQERRAQTARRQGTIVPKESTWTIGGDSVNVPVQIERRPSVSTCTGVQGSQSLPTSGNVATVSTTVSSNLRCEQNPVDNIELLDCLAKENEVSQNQEFMSYLTANNTVTDNSSNPMLKQQLSQISRWSSNANAKQKVQLTQEQLYQLYCYWEHDTFVRFRSWGLCVGVISSSMGLYTIFSRSWAFYGNEHHPNYLGIWMACVHNDTCQITVSLNNDNSWQKLIIFLMLFSIVSAIVGSSLSFIAICISALAKKLYYYHSAGEIFFVSGILFGIALALFPLSVRMQLSERQTPNAHPTDMVYHFGHSYWLGFTVTIFDFLASLCLLLDDILKELARPLSLVNWQWWCCCCCCFFRRSRHSRTAAAVIKPSSLSLQRSALSRSQQSTHRESRRHRRNPISLKPETFTIATAV